MSSMTRQFTHGASVVALLIGSVTAYAEAGQLTAQPDKTPDQLYQEGCAACHGPDGGGAPPSQIVFDVPLPDFADCRFASREPDSDWLAVIHDGGPARGFDRMMPAFGDAWSRCSSTCSGTGLTEGFSKDGSCAEVPVYSRDRDMLFERED